MGPRIECPVGAACLAARSSPGRGSVTDRPLGVLAVELTKGCSLELRGSGDSLQLSIPVNHRIEGDVGDAAASRAKTCLAYQGPDSSCIITNSKRG